jgi:hypothetical protein
MAGRRIFRILTYSQLSGIKVKAVIRPKYNNLYNFCELVLNMKYMSKSFFASWPEASGCRIIYDLEGKHLV